MTSIVDKFIGSINELNKSKSGFVNVNDAIIVNVKDPQGSSDAATKGYVDELILDLECRNYIKSELIQNQQSSLTMTRSVSLTSAGGITSGKSGGDISISTGNGIDEGNGGDINVVLGVGGLGGRQGEFRIIGGMNVSGLLKLKAIPDPGVPATNEVFIWFDRDSKKLKIRKANEQEVEII